ncbi:uncharacterized protein LOC121382008 [Gigantopelta aegis]|uniref:uncharacterized protein LOC121382008 n=1 Tax=Gigantopelta aegis TaxID=1735272 RepID=UPI001B88C035|nr:uncharacterized protein LOC121382008 [Gigantopelta aegis]
MNYITVVNTLTFCILFAIGGILSKSLYADSGSPQCSPGWLLDEETGRCYTALPDTSDLPSTQDRIDYCWTQHSAHYRYGACVKDANTATSCGGGWSTLDYSQCVLYNTLKLNDSAFSSLCARLQGQFQRVDDGETACVKPLQEILADDRQLTDKIPFQWKRAFGNSGFGRK